MAEDRIAWHPALLPALQLTFEQYLDALDIQHEQPLNTEPLRIDALIIKKIRDMVIDNPITRIWRRVNVFEYKSPSVSFSVVIQKV
ncbi:MAG: hypothetical protein LBG73_05445 [Spirochaetaceae bacterium]|jgi:hypothetical protein|nr:hypothetical protein [Spirochaetaceae bacterium]